ncbi:MAG: hypothetical protein II747_02395, partial [Clostridia bacterium]|nr:hypothetical protein [Clostridia bacterium]
LIIALCICLIKNDDDGLTKLTLSASIASFFFSISDILLTLAPGEVDLLEGKRKLLSANKTDSANTKNSISNSRMWYGIQMFLDRLPNIFAGLFFTIGCLSLLIIVMFYDPVSFDYLIKMEKPITVTAFAVVFLNYICGEFETEEQNKRNKETEKKDTD